MDVPCPVLAAKVKRTFTQYIGVDPLWWYEVASAESAHNAEYLDQIAGA
jgi:hypothetical protein